MKRDITLYKIFTITVIFLAILYSMFVTCFPPQMHKEVMIYDSAYEIVNTNKVEIETKVLPTKTNIQAPVKTVQRKTVNSPVSVVNVKKEATVATQPVKKTVQQKTISTVTTKKARPAKQIQTKVQKQTNKQVKPQTSTKQTVTKKATVQTKPAQQKTVTQPVKQQQITEQQELIRWNKWRSDLQNKIMQDVKLPIVPQGTVFKFQFDVDKYGKIMNIQTWSTNPSFTPYAIQYIAPVIKSYQGRSILNFPEGSNRISTTVEGGWKISTSTKYSTPADFKDVEKVRN